MEITIPRGMSRLTTLFWLLVFVAAMYACFHVIPFYFYAEEIGGLMQSQAEKAQIFTDAEIRKTIMTRIRELDLPIDDDMLSINRFQGMIAIEAEYTETLVFDFSFLPYLPEKWQEVEVHTFHFHPQGEAELK
jgi:hypothetical protein